MVTVSQSRLSVEQMVIVRMVRFVSMTSVDRAAAMMGNVARVRFVSMVLAKMQPNVLGLMTSWMLTRMVAWSPSTRETRPPIMMALVLVGGPSAYFE